MREDCQPHEDHQLPLPSGRETSAVSSVLVLCLCVLSGMLGYVIGDSKREALVWQGVAHGYMVEEPGGVRWREGWEYIQGPGANILREGVTGND
jgi:hypothetical protein